MYYRVFSTKVIVIMPYRLLEKVIREELQLSPSSWCVPWNFEPIFLSFFLSAVHTYLSMGLSCLNCTTRKKKEKNLGWRELYTLLFTKQSHLVYELRVSLLDSTVVHLFISGINMAKIMDLIHNFGCWSCIDEHCLLGDIDLVQLEFNLDLKRNVNVGGYDWFQKLMTAANYPCIHTLL